MLTTLLAATFLGGFQAATPVQFVVSRGGVGDSYILPLTSSTSIRQARDLLRYGPSGQPHIAVCEITRGADGINRDVLAAGEPLWSWHVSAFLGFADNTAEYMDGSPTSVEQNPGVWFPTTYDLEGNAYPFDTGTIGFWDYTVTQELGSGPGTALPLAPTTVGVTSPSVGKAKVTWVDKSSNEDGFEVQRLHQSGKTWVNDGIVATTPAGATAYTDSSGTGTFMYKVRSFNVAGSSLWAASASVKVR
jgi:hypothetical protein